ncbi:hypothetical protein ACKS0A_00052 [Histoplasma ohiense]
MGTGGVYFETAISIKSLSPAMPIGLSNFWRRTKSIIDLDFLTDDASSLFISAKRMITLFSIYRLTFHTRIHLGTMPISQLLVLSTPSNA